MVGRLSEEKGLKYGLEAAAGVLRRFPSTRFVLAGDGPERAALEDPGDLQLRHADTNFSQRALERADGHRRRALDEPDLVRVFALAQRFDEVERRPPLPARARFHQPLKVSM